MKILWVKIKRFLSKIVSSFKSTKVKLVHDADLEKMLSSIGELEKIKLGQHKCHSCKKTISLTNFGAIYREGNKYYFLCNDYNCLSKFLDND